MNREPMKYDQGKYASMRYMQTNRMACDTPTPRAESVKCQCGDSEQAMSFAAWELRLYLDTHPCDEKALAAYKKICAAKGEKCTYACNTDDARGTVSHEHGREGCGCDGDGHKEGRVWHWIDDPWPWELSANMKGGVC